MGKSSRQNMTISVIFILLGITSGIVNYIFQTKAIQGVTQGLSVGLYVSLIIFFATNLVMSFFSWKKHRTFGTFVKVLSYLTSTVGQLIYFSKCVYVRYSLDETPVYADDFFVIICVCIVFFIYTTRSYAKNLSNAYARWYSMVGSYSVLAIVSVSIAQYIFAAHIFFFGVYGMGLIPVIVGNIDIIMRMAQNYIDAKSDGWDEEKRNLLKTEKWNLLSWATVTVVFFLKSYIL